MKNSTSYSVDSLFKGLRNLLASLPTEEEKLELIQTLAGARQFFGRYDEFDRGFSNH